MSTEEESPMKMEEAETPPEISTTVTNVTNPAENNFVVLDMAGDSEDSEKEIGKDAVIEKLEETTPAEESENKEPQADENAAKPATANPRVRKKPKAPVVDVNSLRKRKWQLKVYPLHAEDLQLSYVSILCKLASESLLYIPSESRHGKAELYVATQKETAAIIGKLLRMEFHHKLLSIEVVRKDTGGKEDGDESKKECKAFLMFDKYLTKKIFDAKGEKGTLIEKIVTLNKLPKAATKDFIGALFPFATEIEIHESDDPAERKATVKCKTPVTSLLVYKSFKRLEINDVHVKLSIDDSVKAIVLPPLFFTPPERNNTGPPDSMESLNQSSLRRRPLITPLNRRVQQIRKKALLTRKRPTRGEMMLGPRGMPLLDDPIGDRHGGRRPLLMDNERGPRNYPGGPPRRMLGDRGPPHDRRPRDRESAERRGRRSGGRDESQVTKEMLQLQNQLNQAIKNQIAMLNTSQSGASSSGPPMRGGLGPEPYPLSGASQRAPLLGNGPRPYGDGLGPGGPRGIDQHISDFGGGAWADRSRMNRERPDGSTDRHGMPRVTTIDSRRERGMERPSRMDTRPERPERGSRDRSERERTGAGGEMGRLPRNPRPSQPFGGSNAASEPVRVKPDRSHSASGALSTSHGTEPTRENSRSGRGSDFPSSTRPSQRNESSYPSNAHAQSASSSRYGDYNNQVQGENGSYYRRY